MDIAEGPKCGSIPFQTGYKLSSKRVQISVEAEKGRQVDGIYSDAAKQKKKRDARNMKDTQLQEQSKKYAIDRRRPDCRNLGDGKSSSPLSPLQGVVPSSNADGHTKSKPTTDQVEEFSSNQMGGKSTRSYEAAQHPFCQLKSTQDESTNKGDTDNRGLHPDNKIKAPRGTQRKIQKITEHAIRVYHDHLCEIPYEWPPHIAPGLLNPGNLCYMNTTVQLLYGMKCTRHLFSSGSFWQGLDLLGVQKFLNFGWMGGFIAVALHTLFQDMHLQNINRQHSVALFKDALVTHHSFKDFDNDYQQDANELLTKLLDTLSDALRFGRRGDPISELFRSPIISWIQCNTCQYLSLNRTDESICLEVAITGNSIGECLSNFFSDEQLHGWKCGCCNNIRTATKGIWMEPRNMLIISLKRYSVTGVKDNTIVTFPLDDLDMSKFMDSKSTEYDCKTSTPAKFALVAVIQHYGNSPGNGHYDLIMRTANTMWYRYNDEDVEPLDASELVTKAAYTIIYCRYDKLHELIF